MSGGSYNYLYRRDLIELGVESDLEAVRDRLAGLGADDVARKVQGILDAIADVGYRRDEMADVLQAVEWLDSNDWSEDQAHEAIAKYRATEDGMNP